MRSWAFSMPPLSSGFVWNAHHQTRFVNAGGAYVTKHIDAVRAAMGWNAVFWMSIWSHHSSWAPTGGISSLSPGRRERCLSIPDTNPGTPHGHNEHPSNNSMAFERPTSCLIQTGWPGCIGEAVGQDRIHDFSAVALGSLGSPCKA